MLDSPFSRRRINNGVNDLFAVSLSKKGILAAQQYGRQTLAGFQLGLQLFKRNRWHKKLSRISATKRFAKSRDSRSMAGPDSSKKLATSSEISYGSRKRK